MYTRSEAIFDVEQRQARVDELNERRLDPSFWNNPDDLDAILDRLDEYRKRVYESDS